MDFDQQQGPQGQEGEYIPGNRRPGSGKAWASGPRARLFSASLPMMGRTLSFGSMLAITVSYVQNESIGWAIIHGLLSWAFVIYAALFY